MCKQLRISGFSRYLIVNKMFERFKMTNELINDQKDIFARDFQ